MPSAKPENHLDKDSIQGGTNPVLELIGRNKKQLRSEHAPLYFARLRNQELPEANRIFVHRFDGLAFRLDKLFFSNIVLG